jgi:hypothetical protein
VLIPIKKTLPSKSINIVYEPPADTLCAFAAFIRVGIDIQEHVSTIKHPESNDHSDRLAYDLETYLTLDVPTPKILNMP